MATRAEQLIIDNCRIHHNEAVLDLVNGAGEYMQLMLLVACLPDLLCLLLYLPLYSPDLNPIEESYSTCEFEFYIAYIW